MAKITWTKHPKYEHRIVVTGYEFPFEIMVTGQGLPEAFDRITNMALAAPDLYAVLDEINTWCGTDEGAHYLPFEPPWYTNLRAALAKARGEQ